MAIAESRTVSVIIPAYNSERYLDTAIRSVLQQTYRPVECIVVDDGSKDRTRQIAESYQEVTYLYQPNSERSAARNNGLRHASGAYVCFLDADDYIAPTKLAEQVAFLERNCDYQAVYSRVSFFRDESPDATFTLNRITPSGQILQQLLYGNFITVHAPLFRKSVVDAVGGFNPALSHNEDWDLFLRLALRGMRFGFIDAYHSFCRLHQSNTSSDEIRMHQTKWQLARQFVTEHHQTLEQKGIATDAVIRFHEADFGKALIASGKAEEGRHHIFQASRSVFPGRRKYLIFAFLSYLLSRRMCARFGGGVYHLKKDER